MEYVSQTKYHVRELNTRSVTLFPTRAQIFREIKNVVLKPGANEVIIHGLSPTVDEYSIKVEGSGAAVITDIGVEYLPNRELFSEAYPDSDTDESDLDQDADALYARPVQDSPEIASIKSHIRDLEGKIRLAQDAADTANDRINILRAYNATLDEKNGGGAQLGDYLATYQNERKKALEDEVAANATVFKLRGSYDTLQADLRQAEIEQRKSKKQERKAEAKAARAREREKNLRLQRKLERKEEKRRIMTKRQSFWPKYCYSVRIVLEPSNYTPATSRRNSISSEVEVSKSTQAGLPDNDAQGDGQCDLVLSYVTASAYWTPSYDLQLSTTGATGALCFDALLQNSTSESWEKSKITLSTSQTVFAGLEDAIPVLQPWHIKLAAKDGRHSESDILTSREERNHADSFREQQKLTFQPPKPRSAMFGIQGTASENLQPENHALSDYQMQLMLLEQQNKKRLMMARQEHRPPQQAPQQAMAAHVVPPPPVRSAPTTASFGSLARDPNARRNRPSAAPVPEAAPDMDDDAGTLAPGLEQLDFQESLVEETGLTTSYDLPGLKTLVPRSTASKQRVARITFTNVVFSHTIVAKYKPAAYLRARMRNNSAITLLKGQVGLTLDNSFMGRTTLPRCSAGDLLTLGLGIDPAIKVIYPKPDVKRTTTGLFSKENSSLYARQMTVQNTRAVANSKPVNLLVLDQIPVSEDERLKVDLVAPRVLTPGSSGIAAGAPAREDISDINWGKATAGLKKNGEVSWQVTLNAGKAVKLALEYLVAMPAGDVATQC